MIEYTVQDYPCLLYTSKQYCNRKVQLTADLSGSFKLQSMLFIVAVGKVESRHVPVSYTHLDVYKRQIFAQFLFVVDLNQHLDQLAQDVDRGNLAL